MPSSSKKQHNFMAAIAHSPAFAKKVGVPQSVGQDFDKADKGRKFSKGGSMATKGVNPFAKFEKSGKDVEPKGMREGSKKEEAFDMKQMQKMAKGGMAKMSEKDWEGSAEDLKEDKKLAKKHGMSFADWEKSSMDEKHDKQQNMKGLKRGGTVKKMASGGATFRSSANGIAQRGKTKGTQIAMKKGGKC
jgi:hypothetical protein